MAETKSGAPILKSLVIAADDGKIYKLNEEDWRQEKYILPEKDSGVVQQMLKWGTTLGFMPNLGVGIGSICYLVNLASIRTDNPWSPPAAGTASGTPSGTGTTETITTNIK